MDGLRTRVDSKNSQTTPTTTNTTSICQLLGTADVQTAHRATSSTALAPTTGLHERGNNTRRSASRSNRQKVATRCNSWREERVTNADNHVSLPSSMRSVTSKHRGFR